jgi:hypothetical protein
VAGGSGSKQGGGLGKEEVGFRLPVWFSAPRLASAPFRCGGLGWLIRPLPLAAVFTKGGRVAA